MSVDVGGDDTDPWMRCAWKNPDLVAHVILSFRQPRILLMPWKCRLDRDRTSPSEPSEGYARGSNEDDGRPSTSSDPPADCLVWGRRNKRSRAVDVFEARASEKAGMRRASPQSPLERCSSWSTSCTSGDGEEGPSPQARPAKRPRSSGGASVLSEHGGGFLTKEKAVQGATQTPVLTIAAPGPAKRPAAKKVTKEELHAVEKSLLEEKGKIQKELEEIRRAAEELKAANRQLQLSLELPKAPVTDAMAVMVPQHAQLPWPPLPDLNEPLVELDEQPNC